MKIGLSNLLFVTKKYLAVTFISILLTIDDSSVIFHELQYHTRHAGINVPC